MSKQPIHGKGSKPRPFSNYKDFTARWNTINWGHKKKDNTDGEQNNNTENDTNTGRIKKNRRQHKRTS